MSIVKYNNKVVLLDSNKLLNVTAGGSFIVVSTNKKLDTLTCGTQTYTLTGDELEHVFPVSIGSYVCTATKDEATVSSTVVVTEPTVYLTNLQLQRLPAGYQEVEYISSTGSQTIDTDININAYVSTLRFFWDFTLINTTGSGVNIYGTSVASKAYFLLRINSGYFQYQIGPGGSEFLTNTPVDVNEHSVSVDLGTQKFVMDDTSYNIQRPTGLTNTLKLFARDGSQGTCLKGKTCTMYDGETILQRLVPCYRISDSKPGMYDTVSNLFFTNSGTGEFIVGPDV